MSNSPNTVGLSIRVNVKDAALCTRYFIGKAPIALGTVGRLAIELLANQIRAHKLAMDFESSQEAFSYLESTFGHRAKLRPSAICTELSDILPSSLITPHGAPNEDILAGLEKAQLNFKLERSGGECAEEVLP